MKKPVIILSALGLVVASLVATPFVVSQWITVTERNHAYQRELEAEAAQKLAAFTKAVEDKFNAEADEFDKDPRAYRKHHPQVAQKYFDFIYDLAWERAKARGEILSNRDSNADPDYYFVESHPHYAELYGTDSPAK